MSQDNKRYEWGDGVFTLLSWFRKDRVKNARVLVAGAGALGNEVVKNLALFGVGTIFVADFDQIEITNLTRSVLFREADADAKRYKAEVVAERASEINPQIRVIPIVGNLFNEVGLQLYRSVDVIIGCLDSRIARYQLNRMAMRAGKPWVDGSIENLKGVVRVFSPGISCYECQLSREEFNNIMVRTGCADVVRSQESHGRVATTPVSASIVGAIQVQEAMKLIHLDEYADGKLPFATLQGRMLSYDGLTNKMSSYSFPSWKHDCPAHEKWEPVIEAMSLSADTAVGDALAALKDICGANALEINMMNNRFIESIASDKPERVFNVMIPESKLDAYINSNEELKKLSYFTLFHKDFIENIDETFPHPEMTLRQVGFPYWDVLRVSTDKGLRFVSLEADRAKYI